LPPFILPLLIFHYFRCCLSDALCQRDISAMLMPLLTRRAFAMALAAMLLFLHAIICAAAIID